MVRGMMRPEDDAIRPKVTIPLLKAWPDDPRIANAVMLVPNSESRKTAGPSDRLARKYSSALCLSLLRNANTPMYRTRARYAKTMRAGITSGLLVRGEVARPGVADERAQE